MKLLFCFAWLVPIIVGFLKLVVDRRVYDLERQDKSEVDGHYTREEYVDLMHILAESNVADPNGYAAILREFEYLEQSKGAVESILEIGFGLGHFSVLLADKFKNASVLGIDTHQLSVAAANNYVQSLLAPPLNVKFERQDEAELGTHKKSVDVITTIFVNHHIFPDEQFVDFLRRIAVVGRKAFIFNDFHRSLKCLLSNDITMLSLKYLGMKRLAQLAAYLPEHMRSTVLRYEHIFSRDRPGVDLMADGGMLSMRKSFSLSEYETMFAQAGYPDHALKCRRLDRWYELMESTCRVVCTADLSWSA